MNMSKQREFAVGDIVRLKSGGPEMTVTEVRSPVGTLEAMVECMWFSGKSSNKREHGYFPPNSLVKADQKTE